MHTQTVLQKFFCRSFDFSHHYRNTSLSYAVGACMAGANTSITSMGQQLSGSAGYKHKIKRMDRLIGNPRLHAERRSFYRMITRRVTAGQPSPVILIDWSPFSDDQQVQCLRAACPVGGRAVALYEQLHERRLLGNRRIQTTFLDQLQRFLPSGCTPIIVADAGFKTPFYRHVERLGWHWVGRLRGRGFVRRAKPAAQWHHASELYADARSVPRSLGNAEWVRNTPMACRLVLAKQRAKGRHDCRADGRPRTSKQSRKNASREKEPWLLAASHSLDNTRIKKIVKLYETRMQIEGSFRDTKSIPYGLGIARASSTTLERSENLLLIATLATLMLWLSSACLSNDQRESIRPNSSSKRPPYSAIFLSRLACRTGVLRISVGRLDKAFEQARVYAHSLSVAE